MEAVLSILELTLPFGGLATANTQVPDANNLTDESSNQLTDESNNSLTQG